MHLSRLRRRQRLRAPSAARGQSLVEFALVLPILLILVMGIVDFARLYTTMLTVESAAREAADYGAFHWYNWQDTDSSDLTAAEMERRACVAARNLPDYVESGGTCSNPAFAFSVDPPPSGPSTDCSLEPSPSDDPCRVTVTLTYEFHLFAPLSLEFGGTSLGLPSSLSFTRDSTFAISNFGIDNP